MQMDDNCYEESALPTDMVGHVRSKEKIRTIIETEVIGFWLDK